MKSATVMAIVLLAAMVCFSVPDMTYSFEQYREGGLDEEERRAGRSCILRRLTERTRFKSTGGKQDGAGIP